MRLINLTPYPVVIDNGILRYELPPTLPTPRVEEIRRQQEIADVVASGPVAVQFTVPINRLGLGLVENLPAPQEGVLLIVSRVVAEAVSRTEGRRNDLVIPDELVRDKAGRIVACKALARVP